MSAETFLRQYKLNRLAKEQRKRKLGLAALMTQEEFNLYINTLIQNETLNSDIFEEFNADFCWRCGNHFTGKYYTRRINLERVSSKKVNPIKRIITTELKDVSVNECMECHTFRKLLEKKCKQIVRCISLILLMSFVLLSCMGFLYLHWDWTHFLSSICICSLSIGIVNTIGRPIVEIYVKKAKTEDNVRKDVDIPIIRDFIKKGYGIGF